MTSTAFLVLQRVVLRSARTRLRPLWALVYRAVANGGAAFLARGEPGAAVYVRGGGLDGDDFLPGLSDVDLVVVAPQDAAGPGPAGERVRRRWRRVHSRLPWITRALDLPRILEQAELDQVAGASALTYGLGAEEPADHGFLGPLGSYDGQRMLLRPGLYGAHDDWRRVRGPERRPAERPRDPAASLIAAWFEIVHLWRIVFPACLESGTPRSADVCLKAVAESARAWLWVAHAERPGTRLDVLQAALRLLPEEEQGLRRAIALWHDLPAAPAAPLDELLPVVVRITARVAALLEQAGDAEAREVRLLGRGDRPGLLPLVDWRTLADPATADEWFFVREGSPGNPALVRDAARDHAEGPFAALCEDGLMVFPSSSLLRAWMRAVQCAVTDPVSFALAAGGDVARFPAARGWCAADVARRGVIEHRAWLQAPPGSWRGSPDDGGGPALELLLTAARAGMFLTSLEEGEPELCLTVTEVAHRLPAAVAGDAAAAHLAYVSGGDRPPDRVVAALRDAVEALPAYAEPSARMRSSTAGRSAMT